MSASYRPLDPFQSFGHLARKKHQLFELRRCQRLWLRVQYAQISKHLSCRHDQRRSNVKANARGSGNKVIVSKARVNRGIFYDENIVA